MTHHGMLSDTESTGNKKSIDDDKAAARCMVAV